MIDVKSDAHVYGVLGDDLHRMLDYAQMSDAGRALLAKWHKNNTRRIRMPWRKDRFNGKMRARADWEHRRLRTLYRGAHADVSAALDARAVEREHLIDRLMKGLDRGRLDQALT